MRHLVEYRVVVSLAFSALTRAIRTRGVALSVRQRIHRPQARPPAAVSRPSGNIIVPSKGSARADYLFRSPTPSESCAICAVCLGIEKAKACYSPGSGRSETEFFGSARTRQGFVRFAHRFAALTRPPRFLTIAI